MLARQLSEEQASGRTPANRLLASTLSQLLDERRSAIINGKSSSEVHATLSKTYNIDPQTLERLLRYINSPTLGETIVTRKTAAEDEEITLTKVSTFGS